MYDLMQLRLFKTVAHHGSFGQAASELRMSTSTVSRQIAHLEAHLGVTLFNRTTRRCSITSEGQRFLDFVLQALNLLETGEQSLDNGNQQAFGTLKMLLPSSFCKHYLMAELASFTDRNPKLELDIHISDYGRDLINEGFDLGVQPGPPNYGGHITRAIGAMRLILVASPAYLASHGVPQTPQELVHHRCIGFTSPNGTPFRWQFLRHECDPNADAIVSYLPGKFCYFDGQNDAILIGAVHGLGLSIADVGSALPHLQSGALKIVLPDHKLINDSELYLFYPASGGQSRKVRSFIDFIVNVARRRLDPEDFNPENYLV